MERPPNSEGERSAEPLHLTAELIEKQTQFALVESFPDWQDQPAGITEYHEELQRFGASIGWDKVIGILYDDAGVLKLGVFVHHETIKNYPNAIF